jgi:hypothetical protein
MLPFLVNAPSVLIVKMFVLSSLVLSGIHIVTLVELA